METENIVNVVPTKQQLLTTKGRVSCTEDGCTKSFAHSGALRMHTVKSHGLIKTDNDKCLFHKRKSADKTVFRFHCPVNLCMYGEGSKKYFNAYSLVKQHYLKVHAEREYLCKRCDSAFLTDRDLKQHQERCGVLYSCGTCPVKYTTKEALHTHCKRQTHSYPEEYLRQTKQKADKKQNASSKPSPTQPVVTIITQPMLLVPVQSKEPVKPNRNIQPKPVKQKPVYSGVRPDVKVNEGGGHVISAVRQDVLIQTDIYGVDTLNLNKNDTEGNRTLYSKTLTHQNTKCVSTSPNEQTKVIIPMTPDSHYLTEGSYSSNWNDKAKKQNLVKRRLSQQKEFNPSSPRRKKMKSTTGIQTSVSFIKKKGVPTVNSTQTTGDYIIETALRHANIQIEKKTVASQVTPQKPYKHDLLHDRLGIQKPKPVLVDSFSQVKQQNIRAETSHNLAESQTMTDIPPSISTQTLQSYLVNQQERHSKAPLSRQTSSYYTTETLQESLTDNIGTALIEPVCNENTLPVNRTVLKPNDNTVQIYDENLTTSVNYVMPSNARQMQGQGSMTNDKNVQETSTDIPEYTAVPLQGVHIGSAASRLTTKQNSEHSSYSTSDVDPFEENFLKGQGHLSSAEQGQGHFTNIEQGQGHFTNIEQGHMTDMGAQAMSASEFDHLLQSSGIFNNSADFLFGAGNNQSISTSTKDIGTESCELASELDFLDANTHTIDMNTQTVDFSFFENLEPIDSNTQTVGVGAGLDFLDMVMTNMETQTLNDDDLASLGLLDKPLLPGTIHTYTGGNLADVGTSSSTGACVGVSIGTDDNFIYNKNEKLYSDVGVEGKTGFQVSSSTSPCFREPLSLNKSGTQSVRKVHASRNSDHSENSPLGEKDEKVRVQTETQTVSLDTIEPLLQTETQTQVESTDTDFVTSNMETQTTFEDLQQLCEWLQ
ncbi:uncharacterized protein LOC132747818 [Ruditapes philippinarum]|uniref:uncharacterized protein LOC132747818 n=1 Tax=Ruditapes philippinarum TaxID=129788 RepID=UPI00295B3372|nr:uncharacterized protein LOC132747818 [Ruditapes philippinarum]